MKITVGLVDLGESLPFDVGKLARILNKLQPSFHFEDAGVVTSAALGAPDVSGKWYDIPRLCGLTKQRFGGKYDCLAAITDCRLTHTAENPPADDLDYFSRSDFNSVAVISVSKQMRKHKPAEKSVLQFAAFLVIEEVAIMTAKKNLTHIPNARCAFNECEDKDLFGGCMESGELCADCVAALKNANVPNRVVESVKKVLAWCRRNSLQHAAAKTLQHPVTGLALGTGMGWFASLFLGKEYYPMVVAVTVIPIFVTFYAAKTRT